MSATTARKALKRRDYEHALVMLEGDLAKRPDGELHALAGLACFQLERYGAAARHYDAAIQAGGGKVSEWRKMLALSRANGSAQVNVHIPKPEYFDGSALVKAPSVRDGDLPRPPGDGPGRGRFKRLRLLLGRMLGVGATVLMDGVTALVGRIFGYRAKIWTNWYGRRLALQVLTLAHMREQLNAKNLKSTYPPGTLVGFQPTGQTPPLRVSHFRTADGSWNNLADPKEGAARTRFLRNVEFSAIRPETEPQLLAPDPREVSRRLLTRPSYPNGQPKMKEVPFLNLLAASWIQFMTHDWINHGEPLFDDTIEVPLQPGDPARRRYAQTKMVIGRTQADPTRNGHPEPAAATSINEVTHWWDGSQIYGSDQSTQDRLRSRVLGKMWLDDNGMLPEDGEGTGVEDAGFRRNWWVGLSMLHTLFVREHNAICDMLHEAYPKWDDHQLFNVARLINAAVMAKIHSIEWTPAILPNRALDTGLNVNWYGLVTFLLRKGKARKTLSRVKVRNAELGGIVGNPINKHGSVFGLSEEFVEVYRLHSLLPETLHLQRRGRKGITKVPFPATRQRGSTRITQRYAMSDLFYSFGNQHPGALELNNFPRFMQELSVPGNPFFDMGTVDIVRARERGVPRYNEFRRQLGLNPIECFDDLTDDPKVRKELESLYGGGRAGVEKLDLLIGTLAEDQRPTNFGFGETLFQIFILNASRRLQADRFYTDSYNEDVYTPEGLRWIDRTDLKTVILRHYPELADTGLANIKNAFEPWDEGPELNPKRHPLREWDAELRDDPWRGNGYCHA